MLTSRTAAGYWAKRSTIRGAFWDIDFLLFDLLLSAQSASGVQGDILEIGALYGKSAILLGLHAGDSEEVVICDVFEDQGVNRENDAENAQSYPGLARAQFDRNYSAWVKRPARVIQELSDQVGKHISPGQLRFTHVDGGHHYDVVAEDLRVTRGLMRNDAIIVMDDFRALHTPGVAAAVWNAIGTDGLIPFCVSEQKLYASWNIETAKQMHEVVMAWSKAQGAKLNVGLQCVAGTELLIIANPVSTTTRARLSRLIPPALKSAIRGTARPYLGQPL